MSRFLETFLSLNVDLSHAVGNEEETASHHLLPAPALLPSWAFPGGSVVKRIRLTTQEPQEIGVQSLGWEDPLEEEIATYSSILASEIPWTEEPGGL